MLFLLVGAALAAPLSPDEAVALAVPLHPAVVRAEADLTTAHGVVRQSTLLQANPAIGAAYGVVGDRLEGSISQDLSLTGEGIAAHRAAVAQAEAAAHTRDRARLEAAAEVRRAWVEALVSHEAAALAFEAFELATRLVAAAEARSRAGEATDLDLRLARLEQVKAAQNLLDARAREAEAIAVLSTLVQRPVAPEDLAGDPLAAAPRPQGSAAERSDVLAAQAAADAANAELARARAATLPAVTLGVFAEKEGPSLVAGPSIGLTLPLWNQNQADRSAADGDVVAARAVLAATQAQADAEVNATEALVTDTDRVMGQLGPDLEADATAALASIEAGFAAGELDLLTTVVLRAEVLDGRVATLETLAAQANARIDALLTHDDPALLGDAQ